MRTTRTMRGQVNSLEKQLKQAQWRSYLSDVISIGGLENLDYFQLLHKHSGCLAIPPEIQKRTKQKARQSTFSPDEETGLEQLTNAQLQALVCSTTWFIFRTIPQRFLHPGADAATLKIFTPWLNGMAPGAASLPSKVLIALLDANLNLNLGEEKFEYEKAVPSLDHMIEQFQETVRLGSLT